MIENADAPVIAPPGVDAIIRAQEPVVPYSGTLPAPADPVQIIMEGPQPDVRPVSPGADPRSEQQAELYDQVRALATPLQEGDPTALTTV